ncbi:MAG: hypothetical protein EHM24_23715 [Acidobacteria bacterium]|nr:MAG: hypothetical protein EHM24_23715 [Acidobacteriota bacterium]
MSASYASGGVTKTATLAVTIVDGAATGSHAGKFSVYDGTRTCLTCHLAQAQEMHQSVHYQWQGDASESVGLNSGIAGKLGGINDFCIYPDINWLGKLTNVNGVAVDGGCAKCHTGLGLKPTTDASTAQLENIDCLVCHSTSYKRTLQLENGSFRFVPDTAAMGMPILQAATNITRPGNATCLTCHAKSGGGDNFKRGDLEVAHGNPPLSLDVHMASNAAGGAGLSCTDCHTTAGHRIAGRGIDLRERDNPAQVDCRTCHGAIPHSTADVNKHTARVNCTVCHIPSFARQAPTDMIRDWSKPGVLNAVTGLYEPAMTMMSNVTPVYGFFNGRSQFYQFGEPAAAGPSGRIVMAGPLGTILDAGAKIEAMKLHQGVQPIDPITKRLFPLKMAPFYETGDVATAVSEGAAAVGWTYSSHQFAQTERKLGLYHQVAPKASALSCTACHGGTRLDFRALGYTPLATRDGKPLCSSCHGAKTGDFYKVHDVHVTKKRYDCSTCHSFKKAL